MIKNHLLKGLEKPAVIHAQCILIFHKLTKTKSFECPKSIRNYEKKIILEASSEAWLTSHLSPQTSEPAYYIIDCRISNP